MVSGFTALSLIQTCSVLWGICLAVMLDWLAIVSKRRCSLFSEVIHFSHPSFCTCGNLPEVDTLSVLFCLFHWDETQERDFVDQGLLTYIRTRVGWITCWKRQKCPLGHSWDFWAPDSTLLWAPDFKLRLKAMWYSLLKLNLKAQYSLVQLPNCSKAVILLTKHRVCAVCFRRASHDSVSQNVSVYSKCCSTQTPSVHMS